MKARMTNNKLQLHNDQTKIILIAPKKFVSSDSVPHSINLDGLDIKLSNTVRNLAFSLDPVLSLVPTAYLLSVAYAIWSFGGAVQHATISLKMSPPEKIDR